MKYPNFIIVGAPRAGTTALYRYLVQHPDVFMSPVKEPHYFLFMGKCVHYEGPLDDERINKRQIYIKKDYINLFKKVGSEKIYGEASTLYLSSPEVPERIERTLKDVKLVAVLRQPADRAFSEYGYYRREGGEPCEAFEEALADEDSGRREKWWSGRYRSAGLYSEQVKRYLDLFGEDRFKVILFDDIQRDMQKVMKDLYQFIGVDDSFVADIRTRHNVSGEPRSKILHGVHGFLAAPNWFKSSLFKPFIPKSIRRYFRENMLNMIRNINLEKTTMNPETRRQLTEYYREDILKLQKLIGRDLSTWLNGY